jgi:hypothetical protein
MMNRRTPQLPRASVRGRAADYLGYANQLRAPIAIQRILSHRSCCRRRLAEYSHRVFPTARQSAGKSCTGDCAGCAAQRCARCLPAASRAWRRSPIWHSKSQIVQSDSWLSRQRHRASTYRLGRFCEHCRAEFSRLNHGRCPVRGKMFHFW